MNKSELIDTLTKLTESNDIAGIRKLTRREPLMNEMNSRELNEDFIINNHRFVKRNGKISLIKDETRYPNTKNAVFVGSYQTRKSLDNNSNESIRDEHSCEGKLLRDDNQSINSIQSGLSKLNDDAYSEGAANDDAYSVNSSIQTDLNDDTCSIQSNLTDLNEMDDDNETINSNHNNEYTLIIEQQQQQINELTNKVGCFMNEVKEQIEYIKANIQGLGRNFISFANAYNNDLVPRTEELEQITDSMKKLFSNFV